MAPEINLREINYLKHTEYSFVRKEKALRCKPKGHGFDFRWCVWNFSLTKPFRPYCGTWVDSASNRNEYEKYFLGSKDGRCVGLTTLPPSCAHCHAIWKRQIPGNLWACPGLYTHCFTYFVNTMISLHTSSLHLS
jgi:hypothetical protein